jgi:hypothetical protein
MATGRNYAKIAGEREFSADGALARSVAVAVSDEEAAIQDQSDRHGQTASRMPS